MKFFDMPVLLDERVNENLRVCVICEEKLGLTADGGVGVCRACKRIYILLMARREVSGE